MSTTQHASGRQREFQARAIGTDMLVTPDQGGILLEKDTLKLIANKISSITKRKFTAADVDVLVKFIRELPPQQFYQKTIGICIDRISQLYIGRNNFRPNIPDGSSIEELARINEITDHATVDEYLTQEVMQTTDNENQFKWTAHAERRGNAVIDRDRVNGLRSSPDNIAPSQDLQLRQTQLLDQLNKTVKSVSNVLNPDFVDHLFKRANSSLISTQTFQGIVLPRRTIPLDSLNRDLSPGANNTVKWYLNVAGRPGNVGNIQIQDTLQQVIRIIVSPFWLPVKNPLYYNTIRMNIREFWQRAEVTDYIGSNQSDPHQSGYHFQFKVTNVQPNKVFLVPENFEYTFSKPVAEVNSLTLEFRDPFQPVVLNEDRGIYTVTYGNPTVFTLTSGANNNLSTGDIIYSLNFNSPDSIINAAINTQQGLNITKITATQFTVAIDTNSLGIGSQADVQVLYGAKRIFMQMEFVSLEH
jgi:hypothetical protein